MRGALGVRVTCPQGGRLKRQEERVERGRRGCRLLAGAGPPASGRRAPGGRRAEEQRSEHPSSQLKPRAL